MSSDSSYTLAAGVFISVSVGGEDWLEVLHFSYPSTLSTPMETPRTRVRRKVRAKVRPTEASADSVDEVGTAEVGNVMIIVMTLTEMLTSGQ